MIPGIETLLGGALGGLFRLGQAFLETREKQRDRDHEFRMMELQGRQAVAAAEARLREVAIDGQFKLEATDVQAIMEATKAQALEASTAGGWAAFLSATVRPVLTYLLALLYIGHKIALIGAALMVSGDPLPSVVLAFTEADHAILSSILSFWFVDRSLRKGRSPITS
jgi:hypothetical protein